ncbi:hypothetical protein ABBQ32_000659 [Trebouxia sp. C0010 RCD-2024]
MSESTDTAARGPPAASVGLKTESGANVQTKNATLGVPRNQGGYLSKLFGLGSGKNPAVVDRSPAAPQDEAFEYHPELAFSPTDVGIWEPHSDQRKPLHPPPSARATTEHGNK